MRKDRLLEIRLFSRGKLPSRAGSSIRKSFFVVKVGPNSGKRIVQRNKVSLTIELSSSKDKGLKRKIQKDY